MGNAIIWDSMIKEIRDKDFVYFQHSKAWENRTNWKQVPYGTIGKYVFVGNPIMENGNFWLFMHDSYKEAPLFFGNLLNKPASQYSSTESPGENGMLYGWVIYPEGTGRAWVNYYPDPQNIYIIKNQADEVIIKALLSGSWAPTDEQNIIQYRVKANTGWFEETPQTNGIYSFGVHSGGSFSASPPTIESMADTVWDKTMPPNWYLVPVNNKYAIYGLHQQRYPFLVIPADMPNSNTKQRVYCYNDACWVWELDALNCCTVCANNAVYIGTVNRANTYDFAYPNTYIQSGGNYIAPFRAGVAGRWRISGQVNGVYYTQTKDVAVNGNIIFTSPTSGTLQKLVGYLYDRNSSTPSNIQTPQDILKSISGYVPSPLPPPPPPPPPPSPEGSDNSGLIIMALLYALKYGVV